MPGVRLPQNKEELQKATNEILTHAERQLLGESYESKPGSKKPRPDPFTYHVAPGCFVLDWLADIAILGGIQEHELQLRADHAILEWPKELRGLAGRDIVRILTRRRWARTHQ